MAKARKSSTKGSARKAGRERPAAKATGIRAAQREEVTPDRRKVTNIQAQRLAKLTNLKAKDLVGNTVADLSERLRWRIDPTLFFFREICGRVVKRDPATGELRPVPFATVHVMDADCSLLWFFPFDSPWCWGFPIKCSYEEIATTTTDECGRFCVLVPRWDIDWILRWRFERHCTWDIFLKPTIRDLLEEVRIPLEERPISRGPWPEPDPPPILNRTGGMLVRRAEELVGPEVARKLAAAETLTSFGSSNKRHAQLLDSPAFSKPLPPPLPADALELRKGDRPRELAGQLKVNIDKLDPARFIGPFRRCWYELFPEWSLILDVPDITFRVTQDVDGDGVEETIYDEGFFDIRWNAGAIPDVTLEASQIAVAGLTCDVPEIPCTNTPVIVMAGFMPLQNLPNPPNPPYHDAGSGYARRPNRPRPSGIYSGATPDPAESPFCDDLHLRGCHRIPGAHFYRLRYSYDGGPIVPFTNLTWSQFRFDGQLHVLNVTPDSDGWYEILSLADGWMDPNLLLNLRTGLFQNGLYLVDMQLGDATKTVIPISGNEATDPIGIMFDNSSPNVDFTVAWRRAGDLPWIPMEQICPVVTRAVGQKLEFRLNFTASATHLRSVGLGAGGCGAGTPIMTSALPPNWQGIRGGIAIVPPDLVFPPNYNGMQHWHTSPGDNSVGLTAYFELSGGAPQGVYSFSAQAEGRTFNPAGGDSGDELDWFYDPVYRWTPRYTPFAVVNE